MNNSYMKNVISQTPTRFWINNPTGAELATALAEGAVSGTTNPAYPANLIRREPDYALPILDAVVAEADDDEIAADLVYQRVTTRFMEAFLPAFERSNGQSGFVTMQDDPCRDHESDLIIEAATRHSRVGKNYMAKIPVTESGMEAMAHLIDMDMPICATECFAIAQATAMCDLYEKVAEETDNHPPFYLTHITGIYDDELKDYVAKNNIDISPAVLRQAGCIVARRQYRVLRARGYHATMLGGGARGMHHFTEFVGGDLHITMNWSTVQELNDAAAPVESRIDFHDSQEVIGELGDKIPDFRRAYDDDGMTPEEFEYFAPLQRFRNSFAAGCDAVKTAVRERRAAR